MRLGDERHENSDCPLFDGNHCSIRRLKTAQTHAGQGTTKSSFHVINAIAIQHIESLQDLFESGAEKPYKASTASLLLKFRASDQFCSL